MGSCMGNDIVRGYSSFYQDDIQLYQKSDIYRPLPTSLFNTIRKTVDCVIITSSKTIIKKQPNDLLRIDFDKAVVKDLKTLLNFKKIVFIGESQSEDVKKIKSMVSFAKFYVVSESVFNSFVQDYPIFTKQNWSKNEMVTNKLPLMIIDSKQFIHNTEQRIKLFVHSTNKKNQNIYKLLGINSEQMIIKEPSAQIPLLHTKNYYINALKIKKCNTIIILHNSSINSDDICDTLATYLLSKYGIPMQFSQTYLKRKWPNSKNAKNEDFLQPEQEYISKTANIIVTGVEKYKILFQKLQSQSNQQKTERAYHLLSTLIINIYSNPNNQDSYRQVKRTNKQINELLAKYKHGIKLLDELGFRQKQEHWVNTVESKYLKIFKTDFDLGFKRYKSHDAN